MAIGSDNNTILRAQYSGSWYDLDLNEQLPIRMDIQAVDNADIGEYYGISSQNITLPGTKTNNAFFNNASNVGATDIPGLYKPIDCEILANNETILQGTLVLNDIVADDDGYTNYSITIKDNFIGFKDSLKGKIIGDISFSEYNHTYNATNITSSWENGLFGGDIFYPMIDQGMDQYHNPQSFGFVQTSGDQTETGSFDNLSTPLVIEQFQPSIRAKVVLDKVFKQSGFTYSSNFLESDDFQNIYILPKADDNLGIASDTGDNQGFIVNRNSGLFITSLPTSSNTITAVIDFNHQEYDPAGNYSLSNDRYTAPLTGYYRFECRVVWNKLIDAGPPPIQGGYVLAKLLITDNGAGGSGSTIYGSSDEIQIPVEQLSKGVKVTTELIPLTVGDQVKPVYRFTYTYVTGVEPQYILNNSNSYFQSLEVPIIWNTATVKMAGEFDSKTKSLDFIKGLFQKFNLIGVPSPTDINGNLLGKHFVIEPFNDFMESGEIKDWTSKFDNASRIKVSHPISEQPQQIKFTDEDDSDRFSQQAKDNNPNEQYGTKTYTDEFGISEGEESIGSFFSPIIPAGILRNTSTNSQVNITNGIPHLYKLDGDKPRKTIKYKPKIGYKKDNVLVDGLATNGSGKAVFQFAGQEFEKFSTLSNINGEVVPKDLWFSTYNRKLSSEEIPLVSQNAYDLYWENYIEGLYWEESRKLILDILFSPQEYKNIKLNDKIFIKDQLYRINKIKGFNINKTDKSQVELIKLYPKKGI